MHKSPSDREIEALLSDLTPDEMELFASGSRQLFGEAAGPTPVDESPKLRQRPPLSGTLDIQPKK